VLGSDDILEGNFIGTDPSGMIGRGNDFAGVYVYSFAKKNTIGGASPAARNVISGLQSFGVLLDGDENVVLGNLIGLAADGVTASGNGYGVLVDGAGNIVGGTTVAAGNVISGNRNSGIALSGIGNLVQGNLIGLSADGTAAVGNVENGVLIYGNGTDPTTGNIIGGTDA